MFKSFHLFPVFIIALVGCTRPNLSQIGRPAIPIPADTLDRPFVFIELLPGLAVYPSTPPSGLLLAIWSDGRILRAKSEPDAGRAYVRGKLSPADLKRARQILSDSGILSASPSAQRLVLDAPEEKLNVRWGNAVQTWSHNPGFENTGNAESSDARMTRIKDQLLALPMSDIVPEPQKDPWIPGNWRE